MVKLWLHYTDGKEATREFFTKLDAEWFAKYEGDHLVEYEITEKKNNTTLSYYRHTAKTKEGVTNAS